MPLYDFVCGKCEARAEEFLPMADCADPAKFPKCGNCHETMERLYASAPMVSGHGFTPYFNQGLGRVVHSAAEQDKIAKELGIVPLEGRSFA